MDQVELNKNNESFNMKSWAQWVLREEAQLIPGVKRFIKSNPIYKISMNVRHRLNDYLRRSNITKKNKTTFLKFS